MDEEAIGYTITLERTERTPLNARGMYYNQFWHDTKKYWTDLTENAVVFILDDESDSGGGEGGSDITVEALSVTENGTYTAESGKAYSPVTVNVPSDFSVATISCTNTNAETSAYGIRCVIIDEENNQASFQGSLVETTLTLKVPLYKGKLVIKDISAFIFDASVEPTLSGGVTYDAVSGTVIITGDGSISAAGNPSV